MGNTKINWTDELVEEVIYLYLNYTGCVQSITADEFIRIMKNKGIEYFKNRLELERGGG